LKVIKNWWKILSIVLLIFAFVKGFLGEVPRLPILNETIRNLYFHVGMWFAMIALMTGSVVYALLALIKNKISYGIRSTELASVGVLMGTLGVITGMLWGNYTWGSPWPDDPKIHGAALTVLIYLSYFRLLKISDIEKRTVLGAAYNFFAYAMMILFLIVYPRTTVSLHPGNGGNPGFNNYDLDNAMRMVFYPAVLGWILLGVWIAQIRYRWKMIENKKIINEIEND